MMIFLLYLAVQFLCIPPIYFARAPRFASSDIGVHIPECTETPNITIKATFKTKSLTVLSALVSFDHETCASSASCDFYVGGPKIRSFQSNSFRIGSNLNLSTTIVGNVDATQQTEGSLDIVLNCFDIDGSILVQQTHLWETIRHSAAVDHDPNLKITTETTCSSEVDPTGLYFMVNSSFTAIGPVGANASYTPLFRLRYIDAYTNKNEVMRFLRSDFNYMGLKEVSRIHRPDFFGTFTAIIKFNATLLVVAPTVAEIGKITVDAFDGNSDHFLCSVDLSPFAELGKSNGEFVDLSDKHDQKRIEDLIRDTGFLIRGRAYKFGFALSDFPQPDSQMKLRALNSFDVCGFTEHVVSAETLSGPFGGWTVQKQRNITTTAYVLETSAAFCSIEVTYMTRQRNGKWGPRFEEGALSLIVTDIENAYEEYGMSLKTEPPLGQIFEGSRVCLHCNTQRFYYSNETWIIPNTHDPNGQMFNHSWYDGEYSRSTQLCLQAVTMGDSRNYYCNATFKYNNTLVPMMRKLSLQIRKAEPPLIEASFNDRREMSVTYDTSLELTCRSWGKPRPLIMWYLNGHDITATNAVAAMALKEFNITSTVRIPRVSSEDGGNLTCIAANTNGTVLRSILIKITGSPSNYKLAIILAPIFAVAFVAVGLGFAVSRICKWRRWRHFAKLQNSLKRHAEKDSKFHRNAPFQPDDPVSVNEQTNLIAYDRGQFEISLDRIKFLEHPNQTTRSGNFAKVLQAKLRQADGSEDDVAVKSPYVNDKQHQVNEKQRLLFRSMKQMITELKLLIHVGDHPFIVKLIGAYTAEINRGKLLVVLEFCHNGSLFDFLRSKSAGEFINELIMNEEDYVNPINSSNSIGQFHYRIELDEDWAGALQKHRQNGKICTGDLLGWLYQVARAMEYLGAKKALHRDLSAKNVLLTADLTAKVCDFGLAFNAERLKQNLEANVNDQWDNNQPIPTFYIAPEAFQLHYHINKTDVWSYGVLAYEVFTLCSRRPYSNWQIYNQDHFLDQLRQGNRLNRPRYASDAVYSVMRRCWEYEAEYRICFNKIADKLAEELRSCSPSLLAHTMNMKLPLPILQFELSSQNETDPERNRLLVENA